MYLPFACLLIICQTPCKTKIVNMQALHPLSSQGDKRYYEKNFEKKAKRKSRGGK